MSKPDTGSHNPAFLVDPDDLGRVTFKNCKHYGNLSKAETQLPRILEKYGLNEQPVEVQNAIKCAITDCLDLDRLERHIGK